mmetsp:Transcript_131590/g.262592  ORF Transcript_131590/g.262592 Transcript_131590/m.262592 type:complete len:86 (+) Transcript_131590:305-562(+)
MRREGASATLAMTRSTHEIAESTSRVEMIADAGLIGDEFGEKTGTSSAAGVWAFSIFGNVLSLRDLFCIGGAMQQHLVHGLRSLM